MTTKAIKTLQNFLIAAAICTAGIMPSYAVVIVGNSTSNDSANVVVGEPDEGIQSVFAASFTMPTQSYSLTDVLLRLNFYDGPDEVKVTINLDSGSGTPGAQLALLNDPPAAGAPDNYLFTPPSLVTLAANTTYWLVVDNEGRTGFGWVEGVEQPTGVAAFNGYAVSLSNGFAWMPFSDYDLRFTINGEPITATAGVPEHGSTAMLLGAALLSFVFISCRRRFARQGW